MLEFNNGTILCMLAASECACDQLLLIDSRAVPLNEKCSLCEQTIFLFCTFTFLIYNIYLLLFMCRWYHVAVLLHMLFVDGCGFVKLFISKDVSACVALHVCGCSIIYNFIYL